MCVCCVWAHRKFEFGSRIECRLVVADTGTGLALYCKTCVHKWLFGPEKKSATNYDSFGRTIKSYLETPLRIVCVCATVHGTNSQIAFALAQRNILSHAKCDKHQATRTFYLYFSLYLVAELVRILYSLSFAQRESRELLVLQMRFFRWIRFSYNFYYY